MNISNVQMQELTPVVEPSFSEETPSPEKLTRAVKNIFDRKETLRVKALENKWDRYNPFIIGGDAFTMATFAFQGAQVVAPQLSQYASIVALNMACGLIAGVINIGVGAVCFKESMQAFHNGDRLLGIRLFVDSITLTAIGTVMILIALSTKVACLGAIGTFFHLNAWVLPVLFFVISIPVILEILRRINNIHHKGDLASKLDLPYVQKLLDQGKIGEACAFLLEKLDLHDIQKLTEEKRFARLSEKMERLQADMGAEAALAVFNLLTHLQEEDLKKSQQAAQTAKDEIRAWNNIQHVRLFQQFLYVLAFVVSLILLSPKIRPAVATTISATQQFSMTAANAIPLYIDSTEPFKRNPNIVIPKVEYIPK